MRRGSSTQETASPDPCGPRRGLRAGALGIGLILLAAPGGSAAAQTPASAASELVWCHDAPRDLVQPLSRADCKGVVLSDAAGLALDEEIRQRRLDRMRAALAREEAAQAAGLAFASAGAGFLINESGDVLTSAHVVMGCDALGARPAGLDLTPFHVLAMDAERDLAIGRLDSPPPGASPVRFAPRNAPDGDPAALFGFPHEGMIPLRARLTPVHLDHSVAHPERDGATGLRGDVRRGHSGGPVMDSQGRVTGLLKAKVDSVEAWRRSGRLLKEMGVMLARDELLAFLNRAQAPYHVAPEEGPELTGEELYALATPSLARIDCFKRRIQPARSPRILEGPQDPQEEAPAVDQEAVVETGAPKIPFAFAARPEEPPPPPEAPASAEAPAEDPAEDPEAGSAPERP
ncbi:serine protease [Neomegalonema sp.]|uniref:S1 family peptidase n=1 Tax=Neomegalonema sp. TaxID=2039713 RepID=UPI00262BC031|nr:serine protease [Neomegalonema sp.]MDD2868765.1 serine protease [Neomegalonema sp.]